MPLDFPINAAQPVSNAFLKRGIADFRAAADFIRHLPYARNANKNDLLTVFTDHCGTCSTKHALLKQLADENGREDVRLIVGLFKMNATNTPEVRQTLEQAGLDFIPEAHCYLRTGHEVIDVTKSRSEPGDFISDLIEEMEIRPDQIADLKVRYQQDYFRSWIAADPSIPHAFEQLWEIREQCIKDLGNN